MQIKYQSVQLNVNSRPRRWPGREAQVEIMAFSLISAALKIIYNNENKRAQILSPRQQLSLLFTNIPAQICFGCHDHFLFL